MKPKRRKKGSENVRVMKDRKKLVGSMDVLLGVKESLLEGVSWKIGGGGWENKLLKLWRLQRAVSP